MPGFFFAIGFSSAMLVTVAWALVRAGGARG